MSTENKKDTSKKISFLGRYKHGSLRRTLLITLLSLTLIPIISISTITIWRQYENSRAQIVNQLTSVAALKEAQLLSWFNSLSSDLELVVANPSVRAYISELINSQHNEIVAASWRGVIEDTLKVALVHENKFDEIFIIDERGKVIISTDPGRDAHDFSDALFFQESLNAPFVQAPSFSPIYEKMVIFAAVPLYDENNRLYGVLAGTAKLETFNEYMLERAGLGDTGETYLVNMDHVILTEVLYVPNAETETIYTWGVEEALLKKNHGNGAYQNYQNPPNDVLGVYRWVSDLEVALIAEQSKSESFAKTYQNISITLSITLLTIIITILVVIRVTDYIVEPLTTFIKIAERATGDDLTQRISLNRDDEIGTLAKVFNNMMSRLHRSIETLEDRVAERTNEILGINTRLTHEIVERQHAEEDLRKSQQRLSLHIEQTILAVIEWDLDFKITKWNPGAERIFGYKKAEAIGQHAQFIVSEKHYQEAENIWSQLLKAKGGTRSSNQNITKDGQIIYCEWYNTPLIDPQGKIIGVASLAQDITERKKNEKALRQASLELERLTLIDDLTQIANRRRFYAYLQQEWRELSRTGKTLSLIICDIDHFKEFNDTHGHLMGDECLYQVAQAISRASKRPRDLVARYGGEEFAILLPNTEKEGAEAVTRSIQEELKTLPIFNGQANPIKAVTLSFGISYTIPSLKTQPEDLVDTADQALYKAKNSGRNTVASQELNSI